MILTGLWMMTAVAANPTVDQTFRVRHRVNFLDAGVGEDYLDDPRGRYLARWAEVALCVWDGPPGESCATAMTDGAGHVTFSDLDPTLSYTMTLFGHHDIGGVGRDLWIHGHQFEHVESVYSSTQGPITITGALKVLNFDAATDDDGDGEPDHDWINVAAVTSRLINEFKPAWPALARYFPQHVYSVWVSDEVVNTRFNPGAMSVQITTHEEPQYSKRKYIIAHEMAHMLHYALTFDPLGKPRYADQLVRVDYTADDGLAGCRQDDNHYTQSREYQSAAIMEGYAEFVTARLFNDPDDSDCFMVPAGDLYWADSSDSTGDAYSCEGHPHHSAGAEWLTASVDGGDYLGDYCSNGQDTNRGVELDWQRFFWDVHTKSGLTFKQIADVMAHADGTTWNPADTGPVDDFPRNRVKNAFIALGHGAAWYDHQFHNGVGH